MDGDSAVSSKRSIKRYDYSRHTISGVAIETAGTIDLDIELKFALDGERFSIDVRKNFLEQLKDVYKALYSIGKQQHKEEQAREHAKLCLEAVSGLYRMGAPASEDGVVRQFNALLEGLNAAVLDKYTTRDYGAVFEKYIHN